MPVGLARLQVDRVGRRIEPALALVLHLVRRLDRDVAAEVALDDVEREVHSGGEAAGARDRALVDETDAAPHMDVRELHGEGPVGGVVGRRGLAGEEAGARQQERAGADGQGEVGGLRRGADPVLGLRASLLGRDHDQLRRGGVREGVVGHDLQAARGADGPRVGGYGVEAEGHLVFHRRAAARNHRVLEDLPRSREVDENRALREHERDRDLPRRRRLEGLHGVPRRGLLSRTRARDPFEPARRIRNGGGEADGRRRLEKLATLHAVLLARPGGLL